MLFDLHVHTKEGSPCANLSAKDTVDLYKEKGFDGIVITDHLSRYYMERSHMIPYEDYCKLNYEAYLCAREEGDRIGLKVLYGCELKLDVTHSNDYLVYGAPTEYFRENTDIFSWSVKRLKDECAANGFLFYQAHPFRDYATVVQPDYLYGVETVNGSHIEWCNIRNEIASLWATTYNLHRIAGSDCHSADGVGISGVRFYRDINDVSDLVSALSEDDYSIVERVKRTK